MRSMRTRLRFLRSGRYDQAAVAETAEILAGEKREAAEIADGAGNISLPAISMRAPQAWATSSTIRK